MLGELAVAVVLGCLMGTFTGLVPGIHVNLVATLLLALSSFLLAHFSPTVVAVFIITMGITHTFLDALPSIFLGAPDPDMALAVLPGHQLLLQGQGYEAVKLTIIGSFFALIGTILVIPLTIPLIGWVYPYIAGVIAYILLGVVVFMVAKEATIAKKGWAIFIFMLSGILGIAATNLSPVEQPLFPLLSGLFGISTLLLSLQENTVIPVQDPALQAKVSKKEWVKAVSTAVGLGAITGLLPGLGAAQAAVIASQVVGRMSIYGLLILVGGINTANFTYSIASLYSLQKARNGAVVVVLKLLENITLRELILFCIVALIAGSIATIIAIYSARIFTRIITKVNYRALCIAIICFVTLMVLLVSGIYGLLILLSATAVGLIAPLAGVKRSHAMGCLLMPVILFFLL
ncbi:tripartite tricarboxylate transporter permease [Candidatus Woesearchaeota archaeon]|nr:tripartite tricarboxylate transporter permease [Candidatus Woesearchaeota archaeon]